MLTLRPYQQEAIDTLWQWLPANKGKNPLIEHATGLGKSLLIAEICNQATRFDPNVRILAITHVKELIEQNFAKIISQNPQLDVGVFSASVGRKDYSKRILVGQVQSIYDKPNALNYRHMLLVDECHRMTSNSETQYGKLIDGLKKFNPNIRIIGLTATPFRMKGGNLLDMGIFDEVIHSYGIGDGVRDGYLCPLTEKPSAIHADMTGVRITAGDYNQAEMANRFKAEGLTQAIVADVMAKAADREKILMFCTDVEHTHMMANEFAAKGWKSGIITGDCTKTEREATLAQFNADPDFKVLCNRDVLTTGFDCPKIDCIGLARSTRSAGLYVQMLGRGTRLFDGKDNCLALDYGGNVARFGCVDAIRIPRKKGDRVAAAPFKVCPDCGTANHTTAEVCKDCDFPFPEPEKDEKLNREAANLPIMTVEKPDEGEWVNVDNVDYELAISIKSSTPMLVVTYRCGLRTYREWICIEHDGFAKTKADRWIKRRLPVWEKDRMIVTAREAVSFAKETGLLEPERIFVKQDGKYWKVTNHDFNS